MYRLSYKRFSFAYSALRKLEKITTPIEWQGSMEKFEDRFRKMESDIKYVVM